MRLIKQVSTGFKIISEIDLIPSRGVPSQSQLNSRGSYSQSQIANNLFNQQNQMGGRCPDILSSEERTQYNKMLGKSVMITMPASMGTCYYCDIAKSVISKCGLSISVKEGNAISYPSFR